MERCPDQVPVNIAEVTVYNTVRRENTGTEGLCNVGVGSTVMCDGARRHIYTHTSIPVDSQMDAEWYAWTGIMDDGQSYMRGQSCSHLQVALQLIILLDHGDSQDVRL